MSSGSLNYLFAKRYELKRQRRRGAADQWFAFWGGNGTQLRAATLSEAVVEFQERREEIVAYWTRHAEGMARSVERWGTGLE